MKRAVGILLSWGIAALLCYAIFFMFAPFVSSTIPVMPWKPFLDVVVYIVIGWCGGIGFPLTVGCLGTILSFQSVPYKKRRVK